MRRVRLLTATTVAGLALVACSTGGADDAATSEEVDMEEASDESLNAPADRPAEDEGAEQAGDAGGDDSGDGESEDSAARTVGQTSIQAGEDGRHVIYNVDLYIETENLARSTQQAVALAESAGGFVSREDMHGDQTATLTLRVPTDSHASIVSELESIGEVVERSRHAEDVTSEVVDVDARIRSQERSIARIRELLDEAGDLSDVVSIESELARREAELDSLRSRQAELSSLTTLATITVTFEQPGAGDEEPDEAPTFLSGLERGWDAFASAATYVSVGFGAALPFLAVAAVIGVPYLVLRRRRNAEGARLVE